jgi:hypothetical protein
MGGETFKLGSIFMADQLTQPSTPLAQGELDHCALSSMLHQ